MKSINWSKYILAFVLLWLPFLGNYSFADEGKLLYSGPTKTQVYVEILILDTKVIPLKWNKM